MRATMSLKLVNKECANLLQKRLPNGDNFIERVQIKAGLLIKDSILNNAQALMTIDCLYQELNALKASFDDELDKFEGQLEKRKLLQIHPISFQSQYSHELSCSNAFSMGLAELIVLFDKLISTLKLLHHTGALTPKTAFYALKQRYQKQLNQLLGKIIQTPSAKNKTASIQELIGLNPAEAVDIDYQSLLEAVKSPFAPGFSPQLLSQLTYQLKKKIETHQSIAIVPAQEAS